MRICQDLCNKYTREINFSLIKIAVAVLAAKVVCPLSGGGTNVQVNNQSRSLVPLEMNPPPPPHNHLKLIRTMKVLVGKLWVI